MGWSPVCGVLWRVVACCGVLWRVVACCGVGCYGVVCYDGVLWRGHTRRISVVIVAAYCVFGSSERGAVIDKLFQNERFLDRPSKDKGLKIVRCR